MPEITRFSCGRNKISGICHLSSRMVIGMKKMIFKIDEVKSRDNLILWVKFKNGEIKLYDVKPLLAEIKAFRILEDNPTLFDKVHVASGGYGIIWNEEIDLSCDELWYNGKLLA